METERFVQGTVVDEDGKQGEDIEDVKLSTNLAALGLRICSYIPEKYQIAS